MLEQALCGMADMIGRRLCVTWTIRWAMHRATELGIPRAARRRLRAVRDAWEALGDQPYSASLSDAVIAADKLCAGLCQGGLDTHAMDLVREAASAPCEWTGHEDCGAEVLLMILEGADGPCEARRGKELLGKLLGRGIGGREVSPLARAIGATADGG